MASLAMAIFLYSCLLLAFLSHAQEPRTQSRSPHGIAYENPVAFPPSAFAFFHPNYAQIPTAAHIRGAPGHPLAAVVPETTSKAKADPVFTWPAPTTNARGGLGAGGMAAVVFGAVFAVLLVVAGVLYAAMNARKKAASTAATMPKQDA